jgi:hypothetical protein
MFSNPTRTWDGVNLARFMLPAINEFSLAHLTVFAPTIEAYPTYMLPTIKDFISSLHSNVPK